MEAGAPPAPQLGAGAALAALAAPPSRERTILRPEPSISNPSQSSRDLVDSCQALVASAKSLGLKASVVVMGARKDATPALFGAYGGGDLAEPFKTMDVRCWSAEYRAPVTEAQKAVESAHAAYATAKSALLALDQEGGGGDRLTLVEKAWSCGERLRAAEGELAVTLGNNARKASIDALMVSLLTSVFGQVKKPIVRTSLDSFNKERAKVGLDAWTAESLEFKEKLPVVLLKVPGLLALWDKPWGLNPGSGVSLSYADKATLCVSISF